MEILESRPHVPIHLAIPESRLMRFQFSTSSVNCNIIFVTYLSTLPLPILYSDTLLDDWWTANWKVFWRKGSCPKQGIIPKFAWRSWGKTIKDLNQDSWCLCRDSNQTPPPKNGVLSVDQRTQLHYRIHLLNSSSNREQYFTWATLSAEIWSSVIWQNCIYISEERAVYVFRVKE